MADELKNGPKIIQFTNVDQAVSDAIDAAAVKSKEQFDNFYVEQISNYKQAEQNNLNTKQNPNSAEIIGIQTPNKQVAIMVGAAFILGYYLTKGKI